VETRTDLVTEVFGVVGRFRRQQHDADIAGNAELIGGVPSGLIDEQDGMGVGGDRLGYLGEVQVHRRDVAERKDQPRRLALRRPWQRGRGSKTLHRRDDGGRGRHRQGAEVLEGRGRQHQDEQVRKWTAND